MSCYICVSPEGWEASDICIDAVYSVHIYYKLSRAAYILPLYFLMSQDEKLDGYFVLKQINPKLKLSEIREKSVQGTQML